MALYHYLILSLYHSFILSLCHYPTISLCHYIIISLYHYNIISLYHYITVSFYHYIIISFYHYIISLSTFLFFHFELKYFGSRLLQAALGWVSAGPKALPPPRGPYRGLLGPPTQFCALFSVEDPRITTHTDILQYHITKY